ncbi:methionine ABC transporter ATP-binding protein [Paenibacillus xerothermodurans]|uniref:Methionine ABC transporter ATP-binding protein n=1 Tax=Paenibacillus xerothermodurans TaxID=1977292 RepID=A0A2W1NGV8_PAEXE|nr:methionine ABC transporter ATP-binding protein [Paenibacillus xerothermodurans]PZE22341.1 methionine ABC transporter ATP-binding protein [Paenibacillus xerothermodurans]
MIQLEQVTKTYGVGAKQVSALSGIDLNVRKGEIFGIIGHSGAGKSTLLRSMNLLERPSSGKVVVDGIDLMALNTKRLQESRRRIGMIFQHFNLLSSAPVADNIAFPLTLVNATRSHIQRKVDELLELTGLQEHRHKYPAQLSGGQKQRVGIARALANDPQVLLCDEATSALDPQTTNSILNLLLDINKRFGLTIVLITHEMHVIRSICDRVAVIHQGRIVEHGTVAEVFLKPQHAITMQFIDQVADQLQIDHSAGERAMYVKLNFLGGQTYEPILSRAVQTTGVTFSILQGTISKLKDTPYGQLVVKLEGDESAKQNTVNELRSQGLHVEVI